MPDELFRTVAVRHRSTGHRVSAVPLTVTFHAILLAVVVIVPLFAADVLPTPQLPLVVKLPSMPVVVVPRVPPPRSQHPIVMRTGGPSVPLVAPTGFRPELAVDQNPSPIANTLSPELMSTPDIGGLVAASDFTPPPPPKPLAGPLRIGGAIQPPRKIHNQAPVYPPLALAARVQGTVIIEAVITTTGAVQEARVVESIPLLNEAALAAVRQWMFMPTRLDGVPVSVIMTVRVEFRLQ
jgi:protein TonB